MFWNQLNFSFFKQKDIVWYNHILFDNLTRNTYLFSLCNKQRVVQPVPTTSTGNQLSGVSKVANQLSVSDKLDLMTLEVILKKNFVSKLVLLLGVTSDSKDYIKDAAWSGIN